MKFTRSEKGQGCVEFVIGIVLIALFVLAIMWAYSEIAARIRENKVRGYPTAILETPMPQYTPENQVTMNPDEPIPTGIPTIIANSTPEEPVIIQPTPNAPGDTIWNRFWNWITHLFK